MSAERSHSEDVSLDQPLPVLVIRSNALFPGALAVSDDGSEAPAATLEQILASPVIALFCARGALASRDPYRDTSTSARDLHEIGVLARIETSSRDLSEKGRPLVLRGVFRIRLESLTQGAPLLKAKVTRVDETNADDELTRALADSARETAVSIVRLMPELPPEAPDFISGTQVPSEVADLLASNLEVSFEEKVSLLQTTDIRARLARLLGKLAWQLEVVEMRERVNAAIRNQWAIEVAEAVPRTPEETRRRSSRGRHGSLARRGPSRSDDTARTREARSGSSVPPPSPRLTRREEPPWPEPGAIWPGPGDCSSKSRERHARG